MKRIFAIFAIAMMSCASVIVTLARDSSTIKAVLTVTDLKDTCGNVLGTPAAMYWSGLYRTTVKVPDQT